MADEETKLDVQHNDNDFGGGFEQVPGVETLKQSFLRLANNLGITLGEVERISVTDRANYGIIVIPILINGQNSDYKLMYTYTSRNVLLSFASKLTEDVRSAIQKEQESVKILGITAITSERIGKLFSFQASALIGPLSKLLMTGRGGKLTQRNFTVGTEGSEKRASHLIGASVGNLSDPETQAQEGMVDVCESMEEALTQLLQVFNRG